MGLYAALCPGPDFLMPSNRVAWGASARKDLSVNDYLMWEIVKRAKSEGFKKMDFGEDDGHVSPYKAKFNPVLEPLLCRENRVLVKTVNFAWKTLSRAKKAGGLRS